MKKLIAGLLLLIPSLALAAGSGVPLEHADIDPRDQVSLQNGAKLFVNYCLGCHQMQYQRYNRLAADLGIPEELVRDNLIFTDSKVGEQMTNALPAKTGEQWFGVAPPDLTLSARVRGADWLYTYLRSFYADDSRPFGVNNLVFPDVGMPHVLEELQGTPYKHYETRLVDGEPKDIYLGLKAEGNGELSAEEYDKAVLDLVNFMAYTADPVKLERERMGWWVLAFLSLLLVMTYLVKKEYWRDVH